MHSPLRRLALKVDLLVAISVLLAGLDLTIRHIRTIARISANDVI